MITVYYHLSKDEDHDDPHITVTAKDHWDRHHRVDDGESDHYEDILDAITSCDTEELCTSTYEIYDTIDNIKKKMKELGFDLQANEAFSAFLNRPM